MVDRPAEKYAPILRLVSTGKKLSVSYLCDIAGVTGSGYYQWLDCAPARARRQKADHKQHLLIKDSFQKKHGKAGWQIIKMNLERHGIIMNHKKIKRLMKKFGLITRIRRWDPYKYLAKATQEHRTAPNVLQRRFDQGMPYKAFSTDITYLYHGNGQRSYLSVIKDLATGEIVAHHVSMSLSVDLSLNVVIQAATRIGRKRLDGALIHSDQGIHYTSPSYIRRLATLGIVQSMSRKGNAARAPGPGPKDQWATSGERKKMAPVEYRNHLLAG